MNAPAAAKLAEVPSVDELERRSDAFALPASTGPQFGLLILATVAASLFVANWLFLAAGGKDRQNAALFACELQSQKVVAADPMGAGTEFSQCVTPVFRRVSFATTAGTVGLLGLAGLACLAMPTVRLRRRRFRPVTDDVPAMQQRFDELAEQAGLHRRPTLVWNPLLPGSSACAFGAFGRHYVSVGSGLVAAHFRSPSVVDALLRHELAHIANRDVTKTYFAVAIWWVFLVVGVAPFAVTLADEGARTIGAMTWRLAALTALVYLTRGALLRGRERFADLRAREWDGPKGSLANILASTPPSTSETGPASGHASAGVRQLHLPRRVEQAFRLHPERIERLESLQNPQRTYALRPLELFAAGVGTGVLFAELSDVLSTALSGSTAQTHAVTWTAVAATPLAAFALAVAVWRDTMGALWFGARSRWLPGAAALGAGVLLGGEIALRSMLHAPVGVHTGAERATITAAWCLAVILLPVGLAAWVRLLAGAWLTRVRSRSAAIAALAATTGVAAATLAWAFGQSAVLAELASTGVIDANVTTLTLTDAARAIFLKPVTYGVIAALVIMFVAPLAVRRQCETATAPGWSLAPDGPVYAPKRTGRASPGGRLVPALLAVVFVIAGFGGTGVLVAMARAPGQPGQSDAVRTELALSRANALCTAAYAEFAQLQLYRPGESPVEAWDRVAARQLQLVNDLDAINGPSAIVREIRRGAALGRTGANELQQASLRWFQGDLAGAQQFQSRAADDSTRASQVLAQAGATACAAR